MKRVLPIVVLLFSLVKLEGQITIPVIKANFGVDADLRANFFNGFLQGGNDDWFNNLIGGGGIGVIDTTGAAALIARYNAIPASRMQPFFRGMRYTQFQTVNGIMLIDGLFIRDHHGDDSTVFAAGSNKNGMTPATWTTPVSQGIPDKNDILDMMVHVRRAGPNTTDSMWMFGGVSIENTTGNRYFDFEMYQTDIYYDKPSLRFYNYGPDEGHTTWQFDAAGNILTTGDIIFTAEYGTAGLAVLEARIWVHQSSLSITPTAFNWGGQFDGAGAGAVYGYASIVPKTAGDFYTGLQCSNNTWAGHFQVVRQDNSLSVNYAAKQYMEFSVNLTKLGLDPLVSMGDACGMPFRRILAKTRASTSFTAELKDFVGPFNFFRAPRADAMADVPIFCGSSGISNIAVQNPIFTSVYTWRTPNGHIVSDTIGPSITVDQPGMYIVSQQLLDSCGFVYAMDTVNVFLDPSCVILKSRFTEFGGIQKSELVNLNWKVANNQSAKYFELERSTDFSHFESVGRIDAVHNQVYASYQLADNIGAIQSKTVYYRIKMVDDNGNVEYSRIVAFALSAVKHAEMRITPNPADKMIQISVNSPANTSSRIMIYDMTGKMVRSISVSLQDGANVFTIDDLDRFGKGIYLVKVSLPGAILSQKLLIKE